MPVPIQCAQCGAKGHVPDKYAGQKIRCKRCRQVMLVPPVPQGDPFAQLGSAPKTAPRASAQGAARRAGRQDGKSPRMRIGLIVSGLLALAVVGAIIALRFNPKSTELVVASKPSSPKRSPSEPAPEPTPPKSALPEPTPPKATPPKPTPPKQTPPNPPAEPKPPAPTPQPTTPIASVPVARPTAGPKSAAKPSEDDTIASSADVEGRIYKRLLKSTVLIWARPHGGKKGALLQGTGTLIDKANRLILTNDHVAGYADKIDVYFPQYRNGELIRDEKTFREKVSEEEALHGTLVQKNERADLALVQLDRLPEGVDALPFAIRKAATADTVYSVGQPGQSGGLWVYTPGKVRILLPQFNIKAKDPAGGFKELLADVVETSSPTNPGDSGGPLVNSRGQMVAVTQGEFPGARGLSIFIDIGEARKLCEQYAAKSGTRLVLATGNAVSGSQARVPDLLKSLDSKDAQARETAITRLGDMGSDALPAVCPMLMLLKTSDDTETAFITKALTNIGPVGAPEVASLLPLLNDANQRVELQAMAEVATAGPDARPALPQIAKHLSAKDAKIRAGAAAAIAKIGITEAERATILPALSTSLKDSDADVRGSAAQALGTFSFTAADLDMLSRWLTEPDAKTRALGASGLARLGAGAKPALPKLITVLKDSDTGVRVAALSALGAMGRDAHSAVPALRRCLQDSNVDVRLAAIKVVGQMGSASKEAVPALAETARQKELRKAALDVLTNLGPSASEAASVLADLLPRDKENRPAILAAIKAIYAPRKNPTRAQKNNATRVAGALITLFAEHDKLGRYNLSRSAEISSTLASMGEQAVPGLIDGLSNANEYVRWKVAETLGQIGRPARSAARALAIHAKTDVIDEVRNACKAALERVRGADR